MNIIAISIKSFYSKVLLVAVFALGLNGCLIVPIYTPQEEPNQATQITPQDTKPNTAHLQKSYQYLQTQGPFISAKNIHSIGGRLGNFVDPSERHGITLGEEVTWKAYSAHTITKHDTIVIDYIFLIDHFREHLQYSGTAIEYAHTFNEQSLPSVFSRSNQILGGNLALSVGGRYTAEHQGYDSYYNKLEGQSLHSLQILANIGLQKNNKQAYLRLQGNHTGYIFQAKTAVVFDHNLRAQMSYTATSNIPTTIFTPSLGFVFRSDWLGNILLEASMPFSTKDLDIDAPISFHVARIQ